MVADGLELAEGLEGGRRRLRLGLGSFKVDVTEVPGPSLTDQELGLVRLARRSYTAMWGVDPEGLARDPLDGRDPGVYDTSHYLAWVKDAQAGPKLLIMRRVRLAAARLSQAQRTDPFALLPEDVQFFRVELPDGAVTLWQALKAHARNLTPHDELAEFRIASMGRIATFPYREDGRTERDRERTAIAFAAMQLLATNGDSSLLHVWSLCPELRDRVLGIRLSGNGYVAPSFPLTAELLRLPREAVRMDNDLAMVQEHKTAYPGYFIDNADAAEVLADLLERGRLVVKDLAPTIAHLLTATPCTGELQALEEMARLLAAHDHRGLAELLTRPRLFKYLVPLITGDEPMARMSTAELRTRLIRGSGDGPFSSTVIPAASAASARAVLHAAARKYGGCVAPAATRLRMTAHLVGGS